jgi:hypothetical protein
MPFILSSEGHRRPGYATLHSVLSAESALSTDKQILYFILSGVPLYDLLHPPEVHGFLLDSPEGIRIYYIAFWKTPTLSLKERL